METRSPRAIISAIKRQGYKERGLCIICGSRPIKPKRPKQRRASTICEVCAEKQRAKKKQTYQPVAADRRYAHNKDIAPSCPECGAVMRECECE